MTQERTNKVLWCITRHQHMRGNKDKIVNKLCRDVSVHLGEHVAQNDVKWTTWKEMKCHIRFVWKNSWWTFIFFSLWFLHLSPSLLSLPLSTWLSWVVLCHVFACMHAGECAIDQEGMYVWPNVDCMLACPREAHVHGSELLCESLLTSCARLCIRAWKTLQWC